jgi:hypothetical protein
MKLSISLLLPAILGVAHATSDTASVFTFPDKQSLPGTPILRPEEARLVIAQRLGVSAYHNLHHASSDGLSYINAFGGQQSPLFPSIAEDDGRSHLIVVVEGVTPKIMESLMSQWDSTRPTFEISNPPSQTANANFIKDIMIQCGGGASHKDCSFFDVINPFQQQCWAGRSNFVHFDLQTVSLEQLRPC